MSIIEQGSWRSRLGGIAATAILVVPCAAVAARASSAASAVQGQDLVTYVRVGDKNASAYNLADAQAVAVLDIAPQTVLAVHGERNGWLDVEAPGGFQVWVWGEYLEETDEPGVLRVTANDVRMRPLPSSGVESYNLEQRLGRGQKVRVIERANAGLPMDRDWVRVWSPPGARAWVRKSDTAALDAGASGASLWAKSVTTAQEQRKVAGGVAAASAGTAQNGAAAGAPGDITAAMQTAETRFATERKKDDSGGTPDYGGVRQAYEQVLALGATGATAEKTASRLAEVDARNSAFEIRMELEVERARRLREAQEANDRIRDAGNRDPYFGRFDSRGWLVPIFAKGQSRPSYMLQWGGQDVAEVVCFSGRYDLGVFAGFELGINGAQLRGPVEASAGRPGRVPQIDVQRLEVLARRSSKR